MSTEEMPVLGGWSEEKLVTPEVTEICIKLKPDIEKIVGREFKDYIPLSFRSQVVEGTNYMVKVVVSVNECVHALIFEALPCYGGELTVLKGKVFPITDRLEPL